MHRIGKPLYCEHTKYITTFLSMTTLRELNTYLDVSMQCKLVADYCPNGIQVEGRGEIKRLATAVSASLETIQAAVDWKADALIVHHGLFWQGDSYVVAGSKREKLQLLLQNGISLLAYHLPLDMNVEYGNNWKAAQDMGWTGLQSFGFSKGIAIGVQGKIQECSREDFKKQLEKYYQHSAQVAFGGKETVQTAALISGGAYRNISDAIAADVDCFITGNFDEPAWGLAHEGGINFYAMGHSATERVGPQALGEHLRKQFDIEYKFIDTPNPF